MDATRWERLQALFHAVADLAADERPEFLRTVCADDPALVREVLGMLEQDGLSGSLLDRDLACVVDPLVDEAIPADMAAAAFGPYHLVRALGKGGAGVVYLGVRDDLDSVAAIKILRDASLSPARRRHFASEQRILAQLNHPSIARLYDADTLADGTPWFALEYVEGRPLTDYCLATKASLEARLRLFLDVCGAVEYAHRHMIVHRDLKPSNILVTDERVVKLLDFGISGQLDELDAAVPACGAVRLLTPDYAAPEQIRGEGGAGVQVDVYALGVILYELMAGRTPLALGEHTPPSLAAPPAIRAAAGRLAWADLDALCRTALQIDPALRYASVEALRRDVEHFIRCEPLDAQPGTVRYRTRRFIVRNRRALSAAATAIGVIVALVVFSTVRLASARNAAVAEAARTERIQRFMLNLFDGGEREAGPAVDLRVLTIVDRGLLQARALDREPRVQADLFETLGGIYRKLGKFDRAETLLQQSLDGRRRLVPGQPAEEVKGLVAMAQLRSDQAKFDEAERLAHEAVDRARALGPDEPLIGTAMATLGGILEQRGRYDQAITTLDESIARQSAGRADPSTLAGALSELANAHFYLGHADQSKALNERVLAMHVELYGSRHALVADDLINLGVIEHERGRYPQAESLYRRALEINREWYGNQSYTTGTNLTTLGRTLILEKRYDEAREVLQQALAIHEHVFGPVHPHVASALNDLGLLALRRGALDEAEADFRRNADIYRSVYGDRHFLIAVALSNLGSVFAARKDYAKAEQSYRDAVRRFSETQSADHLNTGIARIKLGHALVLEHRYAEAEPETRAGYAIVSKRGAPTISWLDVAREDLAAIASSAPDPKKAAMIRD
jgi:serine/threonine-protein kinase